MAAAAGAAAFNRRRLDRTARTAQLACPLTGLENSLRHQAGIRGFSGGFVEHYLIPVIYPPGLGSDTQWLLGLLALAVNLVIYTAVILQLRKRKRSRRD